MPEGQCRLYEVWRAIATIEHSRMEVEQYKHELYHGLTNDGLQVRLDLGDHGLTLQICPFYTRQHPLQC
jgi:hypothetical protein